MKPVWLMLTGLLTASMDGGRADTVELNGITSLFGEQTACLVLQVPTQAKPISFALAQGESRHGVKLLALDAARGQAEIEHGGQIEFLRLGFAPALSQPEPLILDGVTTSGQSPAVSPLTADAQSEISQFLREDPEADRIRSGHPVAAALMSGPISTSAKPDGSSAGAMSAGTAALGTAPANSMANGATHPASAVTTAGDATQQYWYKASLSMEQNRLATAAQVMSGDMAPLPATPLTPAHTPAALVGPDTYFSNHIPGFICGGSVDD